MNAQESITERIAEAVAAGRQIEAERQQQVANAAARCEEDRKRKLDEQWAPHLDMLRNALPDWAVPYVLAPDQEYDHFASYEDGGAQYAPITIAIPHLAPIAAYVYQSAIYYRAAAPVRDEDGMLCLVPHTGTRNKWEFDRDSETDFAVAVMHAKAAWDRFGQMIEKWEVAQREADTAEPAPERIPLRERIPAIVASEELVAILDKMEGTPEAAHLWGWLMVGWELRHIRIALEDMASALMEPADDDRVVS